ncbi:MAG: homocitrate synthase [Chloroflexi bacterium]|nr:homocitrate synthase [Chloroflexota bacterium]
MTEALTSEKLEPGRQLHLVDLTLRDGEQTAGVVFAQGEKVRIAKLLDEIGVRYIEVGIPSLGAEEQRCIKAIVESRLQARLIAFCRPEMEDVLAAAACGVDAVTLSISTSDSHLKKKFNKSRQWVLERIVKATEQARKMGLEVTASAEDASRTDLDFLLEFYRAAKQAGAARIRYCDTLSVLSPFRAFDDIQTITRALGLPLEMHTHNDFGMATANALAGVRAGADFITVSISGLGERTGNAALEEVVMALKCLHGADLGIPTNRFRELAEYVAEASGRAIPIWKAIVGNNVFAHESGIHADGVIKNPRNYEIFSPEEVGLTRQLVVGKHSGSHTILHKFREFGIDLTADEATEILALARSMAVELKRALFDKELMYIYYDYVKERAGRK